jgi:hypothetical protein
VVTLINNEKTIIIYNIITPYTNIDLVKELITSINYKNLIITGLDLLTEEFIQNFFFNNKNLFKNFNFIIYFLALFSFSYNLTEENEQKKNLIKSKVNYFLYEKSEKQQNSKIFKYAEIHNFNKLTMDIAILEYSLNKNNYPEFDKFNIYNKDYKNLFETQEQDDENNKQEMPSSTFKLTLNEKEMQAKNDVILPYIKNKEQTITIDPDDLNELYEEDPDGDLDI